jgi:hypothetical protein
VNIQPKSQSLIKSRLKPFFVLEGEGEPWSKAGGEPVRTKPPSTTEHQKTAPKKLFQNLQKNACNS